MDEEIKKTDKWCGALAFTVGSKNDTEKFMLEMEDALGEEWDYDIDEIMEGENFIDYHNREEKELEKLEKIIIEKIRKYPTLTWRLTDEILMSEGGCEQCEQFY